MSTFWRILLLLLIWLAYSLVGLRYCSDQVCTGCADAAVGGPVGDTTETISYQRYPIDFSFSSPQPNLNAGYDSVRQSLLSGLGEEGILTITGLYFEEEPAPTGQESMGLARAREVQELFEGDLATERIRLRARTLTREPVREGYFEGVAFAVEQPRPDTATAPEVTLQELADRVIFRFPYNSAEEEYDPVVEEYLEELADELRKSGGRIRIVGHTDSSGPEEYNIRLGRDRAMAIYQKLVGLQVPQEQMAIESQGESHPVAANDSDENRHLNRRVEIMAIND